MILEIGAITDIGLIAFCAFCILIVLLAIFICKQKQPVILDDSDPNSFAGFFFYLGDAFILDNVLKSTLEYFDSHPSDNECTELHYASPAGEDMACRISKQNSYCGQYELLLQFTLPEGYALPEHLRGQKGNPYSITINGQPMKKQAEDMIMRVFGIYDYTKVPYQAAGSDGPIYYFFRTNQETGAHYSLDQTPKIDRRLSYIFRQTWKYFAEHPETNEFTEVRTPNVYFHLFSKGIQRYELLIWLQPWSNWAEVFDPADEVVDLIYEGPDAASQIESVVYEKLGLTPDSIALFQLAGMNGLEIFH